MNRGWILILTLLLFVAQAGASDMDKLRQIIADMIVRDQEPREHGDLKAANEIDESNVSTIIDILDRHGVPKYSDIGKESADDFIVLILHLDKKFINQQKRVISLLSKNVSIGEGSPRALAYLKDRVSVRESQNQLWGTQGTCKIGHWEPYPIRDPEHLDERREAIGLPKLEEYATMAEEACPTK